jgi:hypothetical protein
MTETDMNDTAQIIVAVATLVTAVGSFIMSWVNRGTINKVQQQTNGLMAEIKTASEAKGNLQGRADEKQSQRDHPSAS